MPIKSDEWQNGRDLVNGWTVGSVTALAEAWASIDGKLEAFTHERTTDMPLGHPDCTGHYAGYIAEAEEMMARLAKRGFKIVAA